jgi:type IV pilus assembly protein PilQ
MMNRPQLFLLGLFSLPVFASHNLPEITFSLAYDQIELKDAFETLGRIGGINFIGHQSLEGSTELNLHHVTWKEAFEMLLRSQGLYYAQTGKNIWVAPTHVIKNSAQLPWANFDQAPEVAQQVLIEASIVEADHRYAQKLGVKLGVQPVKSRHSSNSPIQSQFLSDLKTNGLSRIDPALASISMLSRQATQLLQFELSALEADGLGKIVSKPRIITANHVPAIIEQGTDIPYFTNSKEGGKVHFRKANLRLEVMPRINEGFISLDIEVIKDTIGKQIGNSFAINTRHLKSQIMIEDGGTVVIGGVYVETEREDVIKVPLLGDIPILGTLFQHKETIKDKTELLVFLTPSIIDHTGENY